MPLPCHPAFASSAQGTRLPPFDHDQRRNPKPEAVQADAQLIRRGVRGGPPIKGNVSVDSGERIYHVAGQEYQDETKISPAYGERWFCTEAEPIAAGWHKSFR